MTVSKRQSSPTGGTFSESSIACGGSDRGEVRRAEPGGQRRSAAGRHVGRAPRFGAVGGQRCAADRAGRWNNIGSEGADRGARIVAGGSTSIMLTCSAPAPRSERSGSWPLHDRDVPPLVQRHVRQLEAVIGETLRRAWAFGAGPGTGRLVVDVDSTICQVEGHQKQGAAFGYTKVLGYHPLLRADTGEVVHARMRKGSANTARGTRRFLDEVVAAPTGLVPPASW